MTSGVLKNVFTSQAVTINMSSLSFRSDGSFFIAVAVLPSGLSRNHSHFQLNNTIMFNFYFLSRVFCKNWCCWLTSESLSVFMHFKTPLHQRSKCVKSPEVTSIRYCLQTNNWPTVFIPQTRSIPLSYLSYSSFSPLIWVLNCMRFFFLSRDHNTPLPAHY